MDKPCRVVICDDVDDFRTLVVQFLEMSGDVSVVGQASNGQEAVEVVRREQPDVVLLDLAMPVMDGIEALPLIHQAAPRCRVIVLTGFSTADIRERALAGGAVGYIEKGSRPAHIVQAVLAACAS